MIRKLFVLLLLAASTLSIAQEREKEKQQILAEARLLYNSERASWLGTDIFMERYRKLMETKAGGYFSYTDSDKKHKCIFYDRAEKPKVIATFAFDDSFTPQAAIADTLQRDFTQLEKDYYTIRTAAHNAALNDTIFKYYKNANFNYVPLIQNGKKRVFIFTGPTENGVVLFGNDYIIEFGKDNKITSIKALHHSLVSIPYGDKDIVSAMHNHLDDKDELITSTDVCTLLLYGPYTGWESYYVMSDKYVSIWNMEKETLTIITRKAWDKIAEHQRSKE